MTTRTFWRLAFIGALIYILLLVIGVYSAAYSGSDGCTTYNTGTSGRMLC